MRLLSNTRSHLLIVHEQGILVRGVHPRRGTDTLMLAWGDWFGGFALGLGSDFSCWR